MALGLITLENSTKKMHALIGNNHVSITRQKHRT